MSSSLWRSTALPVAPAEMEPHPELVEGQRHAEAVEERTELAQFIGRLRDEDEERAHGGENEDAVVQMVHVRPVLVQEEVRDAARHDENDEDPRGDEGKEEGEKDAPRQPAHRGRLVRRGGSDHEVE